MRKVLAMAMALMMLFSMSISVCAARGGFLVSPGQNGAPDIIDYEGDCEGKLIITPYKDRETLPGGDKAYFIESYGTIAAATNLADLNADLVKIAASKKISTADLVVSDLFYAHIEGCSQHMIMTMDITDEVEKLIDIYHGTFDITLNPETLDKYVTLMNYVDGEWVIVEDAVVTPEGYLQFSTDTFGPFAIVAHVSSAQTGDVFTAVGVSCFAVVAVAMVVILVKTKKRV